MPSPLGGSSYTVQSRYFVEIGSTHSAEYDARSSAVMGPPSVAGGFEDGFGDFSGVERSLTLIGDQRERAGDIGIAKHPAGLGSLAAGEKYAATFCIRQQAIVTSIPPVVNDLRHREPMLGIKDRGLEKIAPGQFSPAIMQLGPSIDHARNG